jgi:tungstate transport system substrate-binding protein
VRAKLWLTLGPRTLFGDGKAELLERIDSLGSLRRAAARMGMSYRYAWGLLRELERAAGFAFLERGGAGSGGRLRLSARGRRFVAAYRSFSAPLQAQVRRAFRRVFGPGGRRLSALLTAALLGAAAAAGDAAAAGVAADTRAAEAAADSAPGTIVFAVGTSPADTGLLDALVPPFEAASGHRVKVIAVGTGQALALAERGEADLVLSHAPEAEEAFMVRGLGLARRRLMFNDFVLVGPGADPAGTGRTAGLRQAFAAVLRAGSLFVSRGDGSGTHAAERRLWKEAGLDPSGPTYLETGQGQAATLRIASQKRGYALCDRGTFLSQRAHLGLDILAEDRPPLRNVYHLIVTQPANGKRVNVHGAEALARFLLSPGSIARLREFGSREFGRPLFTPDPEPYGGG